MNGEKQRLPQQFGLKLLEILPDVYEFWCPACHMHHYFISSRWMWNEQLLKPTVYPAIENKLTSQYQCEVFINRGKLIYTENCSHELKGKTVDMKILG